MELNLIENFKKDEDKMNHDIDCRDSNSEFVDSEERTYKVDSTGAEISAGSSVSLLHHYCSKLPHDEYFNPKPKLFYFDDGEGTICHIILPANAPIHQIVSSSQSSMELAKKDACLKACKELHQVGALTDFLLPDQEDETKGLDQDDFESDGCNDENLRRELHEMLIPAALKESWKEGETVYLHSYFVKFSPSPPDRNYKEFGIFVKSPLPSEAERMELDLHLARGRLVTAQLVPFGVTRFNGDEIKLAEDIQEMFLKAVIDRSEFISESISLGRKELHNASSSTFYLMLPVQFLENGKKCVSIGCSCENVHRHQFL
jgi:endoribonuclease Dicer